MKNQHQHAHRHEHEPDPTFVQNLEWQIQSAVRRRQRFARPATPSVWRGLRSAALVLASVGLGAAGVVAAERIQESRERELLSMQIEIRLEVQRARHDHARSNSERIEALFAAGVISSAEVARARRALATAASTLQLTELDREELSFGGRAPRNELDSPLVAGRDFVSERMRVQLADARAQLELHEQDRLRLRMMYDNGLVSTDQLDRAEQQRLPVQESARTHERLLALRSSFLAGAEPRESVRLLAERVRVEGALETSRAVRTPLERELHLAETRVAMGRAQEGTAREVQQAMEELDAEIRLLEIELLRIDERLGR